MTSYFARPQDLRTVQHEEGGTVFLSTARPFADWVELVPAADVERLQRQVDALEQLRPHWAKGYTDDSMAAQAATAALAGLWEMLGAKHQTDAMQKLRNLLAAADNLVGTWGTHLDRDQQALVDALIDLEKK